MKVIDYLIESAKGEYILMEQVNEAIKDGWQPLGSPFVMKIELHGGDIQENVAQAMVKYEEPSNRVVIDEPPQIPKPKANPTPGRP